MLSLPHILIVLLVIVLLFGRNKISDLMGDVAKGIRSFKKGLTEDDDEAKTTTPPASAKQLELEAERHREERKVSS